MKYASHLLAAASGSVGGCCFSRSKQGPYMRIRGARVRTNTASQNRVRSAFATLVHRWRETLTAAQREGWAAWGQATPQKGVLGRSLHLSGHAAFVRANTPRLLAQAPIIDDAPAAFGNPIFSFANAIAADVPSGAVIVDVDAADPWAAQDGAWILLYASPPQNAALSSFHGSYRLRTAKPGQSFNPVNSVFFVDPGSFAEGQRIFTRCIVSDVHGNLSRPIVSSVVATV